MRAKLLYPLLVNGALSAVYPTVSHIVCNAQDASERLCRVKNLFYEIATRQWGVVIHPTISAVRDAESGSGRLVDLTSVQNHNKLYFDVKELPYSAVDNVRVRVSGRSQLLRRFMPSNLMHVVHDDWLGSWHIQHRLEPGAISKTIFIDHYPRQTSYTELYQALAENHHLREYVGNHTQGYVLLEDAIVGNSKELIWYQYGFKAPQSPLNRTVDAGLLRAAASAFRPDCVRNGMREILIFSRSRNRKIVNEEELRERLEADLGLHCSIVRLEDFRGDLCSLVGRVRRAKAAVGMHGAMLVLGLWLPADALMVELFPYAVRGSGYRPYRQLCELLGIQYRAWENGSRSRTISHPDRPSHMGGIRHLSAEERAAIEASAEVPPHRCCGNANWLYHVYQDTIVDAGAVAEIAKAALEN